MVTKNMLMVLGAIFVFFSGVYMAPVMSAKANEGVVSMTYIAISNCTSHDGKLVRFLRSISYCRQFFKVCLLDSSKCCNIFAFVGMCFC